MSIWQSNVVVEGQLVHQRRISYVHKTHAMTSHNRVTCCLTRALLFYPDYRRKCSFYDLAESSTAATSTDASSATQEAPPPQRLEVILKIIDDELSIDKVDAIRHGVNVGDIVRIHGFIERTSTSILIHARNITPVTSWKELHPGTALDCTKCV